RGVESAAFHQAVSEAKCHGGVVCPLSGFETEDSAASHPCDRIKGSRPLELDCRSQRVAGCQSKKRSAKTFDRIHVRLDSRAVASSWMRFHAFSTCRARVLVWPTLSRRVSFPFSLVWVRNRSPLRFSLSMMA